MCNFLESPKWIGITAIFQILTWIAVGLYTLYTKDLLKKTQDQNNKINEHNIFTSILTIFENLKREYNEVAHLSGPDNKVVYYGYDAFKRQFTMGNDNYQKERNAKTPSGIYASFKITTINLSNLIDEINLLSKDNKKIITPFILSFYSEFMKIFVNSFINTYGSLNNQTNNTQYISIFHRVADQIEHLNSCG